MCRQCLHLKLADHVIDDRWRRLHWRLSTGGVSAAAPLEFPAGCVGSSSPSPPMRSKDHKSAHLDDPAKRCNLQGTRHPTRTSQPARQTRLVCVRCHTHHHWEDTNRTSLPPPSGLPVRWTLSNAF